MNNFFLSHYNGDREIANIIASLLKRVAVQQIQPWFSSDESESGGLKPGMIWFNAILDKINKSKAVIAILTPNSLNRPWIYFETGIAQTLEECEIIPICLGVSLSEVYPPLGLYQCYQLNSYRALKEFVSKFLKKFDVHFDEEAFKPILEKSLAQLLKVEFSIDDDDEPKTLEMLDNLKSHIDKRFLEIWERPKINLSAANLELSKLEIENTPPEYSSSYSVTIEINLDNYKVKQEIEIRYDDTFKSVTTTLYFIMKEYVDPFRYLQSWVIREKKSGKFFVIREVADLIPARFVFKPEYELEVISLKKEYKASLSRERVMNG